MRTWYDLNRWRMWTKEVPWLLKNIVLEDYPDVQFNTRCWHLERPWFDNLAGNMKKTQMVIKKKKKKVWLQWSSRAVWECQKARVYHPWSLSDGKCCLRARRALGGYMRARKRQVLWWAQSVVGEAGQGVGNGWSLWCGHRAGRKWPSQPTITAAEVGPSLTAGGWQPTQEAGWPAISTAGTESTFPSSGFQDPPWQTHSSSLTILGSFTFFLTRLSVNILPSSLWLEIHFLKMLCGIIYMQSNTKILSAWSNLTNEHSHGSQTLLKTQNISIPPRNILLAPS